MWRFALSRRWWAGHLLVAAGCGLFLGLGRWQWDRAHSTVGDWQNLGYALQWPLFAAFLAAAWLRFLWLEQRGTTPDDAGRVTSGTSVVNPSAVNRPAVNRPAVNRPAVNRPAVNRPAARRSDARSAVEDDPDDELAAYNAYLARLADEDQRR